MVNGNITIENARIGFKNFAGKAGQFNPEGSRNFCIFLEVETAIELEKQGWNIKWLPESDDGEKQAYIQVAVKYGDIPPKIILISSITKKKTLLDEESVSCLDWAEIQSVDLAVRPYNWTLHKGTKNEKCGVKAYIKNMYVTIVEDEFEAKYYDLQDSAVGSIGGCGKCDACDGNCEHHKDD